MESTNIGLNRTGIGVSPIDSSKMIEASMERCQGARDGYEISELRVGYAREAPPVGTMPLPTTIEGLGRTAVGVLKGERPTVLLDKLAERLAFERAGVRLYEALLAKFDAHGTWEGGPDRTDLQRHHDEELRHANMLWRAITELGADPTAVTPCADLVGVESMGLAQALGDPRTDLAQGLHAILVAELTDRDSWDLLIRLAESLDQQEMLGRFREALQNEERHLMHVRLWVTNHDLRLAQRELEQRPAAG